MLELSNRKVISLRENWAGLSIILFALLALMDVAWNATTLETLTLDDMISIAVNNWSYLLFICYELVIYFRNWDVFVGIWAYEVSWYLPLFGILLFCLSVYFEQPVSFCFVTISTHMVWPALTVIDLLLFVGLWRRDSRL